MVGGCGGTFSGPSPRSPRPSGWPSSPPSPVPAGRTGPPRRPSGCWPVAGAVVHVGWLVEVAGSSPAVSARRALSPLGTAGVLGMVAAGCGVAAVAVALAPAPAPPPDGPGERALVAALVAHPDADSLAPFATPHA